MRRHKGGGAVVFIGERLLRTAEITNRHTITTNFGARAIIWSNRRSTFPSGYWIVFSRWSKRKRLLRRYCNCWGWWNHDSEAVTVTPVEVPELTEQEQSAGSKAVKRSESWRWSSPQKGVFPSRGTAESLRVPVESKPHQKEGLADRQHSTTVKTELSCETQQKHQFRCTFCWFSV